MNHTLFLLFPLLSLSAWVSHGGQEGNDRKKPVEMTRLRSYIPPWSLESYSGLDEPLRVVIRDSEEWREMWKCIYKRSSARPLPEVDFSREIVVVVAMGQRPTGGHGIIVDSAYERDERLEIVVRSVSPGKRCANTQALTQPVDIVRLPKTQLSIVFREIKAVHECK